MLRVADGMDQIRPCPAVVVLSVTLHLEHRIVQPHGVTNTNLIPLFEVVLGACLLVHSQLVLPVDPLIRLLQHIHD